MNTLQMTKSVPKFDGNNFIERTIRSIHNMLLISWLFLSKLVSGLEKLVPRSGSIDIMENTSDLMTKIL